MIVYIIAETENTEEAHTNILGVWSTAERAYAHKRGLEIMDPQKHCVYWIQEEEVIE